MWRLIRYLFGQIPSIIIATVVALMYGAPPEDLLAKWLKPYWGSLPDWLLSWQFRWALLVAVLLIFFWRISQTIDRRWISLTVNDGPRLNSDTPDNEGPQTWLFGLTIKNEGTEDIEGKCLVKALDVWNESGMRFFRLPFNLRTKGQVDEGRNEPFNLRIGETKTVVLAFGPRIAGELLHVEFVDGWEFRPIPMDQDVSRWLVAKITAYGGGFPASATAVLELRNGAITYHPRHFFERITKSYFSAVAMFYVRRFGRRAIARITNLKDWIMLQAKNVKQRFDRLLDTMLTKPPLAEKPKAKRRASNAATSADCDETQTPQGSSEDAS